MTARDRIDAAVVIAKAVLRTPVALGSEGSAKAIAVALESEGLLVESACAEADVRQRIAVGIDAAITEAIRSGPEDPALLQERLSGLREALRIVLGDKPVPQSFTCDRCTFEAPLVYLVGDRRLCGKCRAETSDRPKSRVQRLRASRLDDLREQVLHRAGAWRPDRAALALAPDVVSERDAQALLDALVAEGVLRCENDPPRWVLDMDPTDPAGDAA